MIRFVLLAAAAAFLVLLGMVLVQVGGDGLDAVTDTPWGQVTLADFYLGVLCFGTVIWIVEGSALRALPWVVGVALLGNPVAALWLVLRGLTRLRAEPDVSGPR